MAYSNTIGILIAAKDEASAVIAKTAAETKAAAGQVNSLGNASSAAGGMLKDGLVLGLIAAAGESANLAIKFQQHMEMLHTNAGVAQEDIAGLSQKLLDMAPAVGQGPDQLAQAFYHIASAGTGIWTASQQLDILKVAAQGAAIGQADLEKTTYALTSAMASGVGGVKDASEMMAVLNATVGAGDMKLEDLNGALSTGILSTAATFGISIQSVGTALATLTDNGEHADEAATRLRMTFALMGSPSGAATKQLKALGLTAEDAKNATAGMNEVFKKSGLSTTKLADDLRQPNGITAAMRDLEQHLKSAGLSSSEADAMLSKAFGGGRTDAALLTMLQNLDRMDEKYKVINKNAGDFSKNFADQQETAAQKIKNVWAGTQSVLIRVGDYLGAVVDKAVRFLAPAFKMIGEYWKTYIQPGFDKFANDLGPALLNILGGALAAAILNVAQQVAALAWVLSLLLVGIDDVVKGIGIAISWIAEKVPQAIQTAIGWWHSFEDSIKSVWDNTTNTIKNSLSDLASGFGNAVKSAESWASNTTNAVVTEIGKLPGQVGKAISDGWNSVTKAVSDGWNTIVKNAPAWGRAVVEGYFAGLKALAEYDINSVMQWGKGISNFLETGRNLATALINGLSKGFEDAKDSVVKWGSDTIQNIKNGFESSVSTAIQWGKDVPKAIGKGFSDAIRVAFQWGQDVIANVKRGFQSSVDGAVQWGRDIIGNIGKGFNQFVSGAIKWGQDVVGNIVKGFQSGVDGVVKFFQDLPKSIGQQVKKSGEGVAKLNVDGMKEHFGSLDKMNELGTAILKGIGIAVGAIVAGILLVAASIAISLVNGIIAAWNGAVHFINEAIANTWNAVAGAFASWGANMAHWAGDAVNSIVDEFRKLPEKIGGFISDAWKNASNGVSNAANGVGNWISNNVVPHALGTSFSAGGTALVGEHGPELVHLPRGAQVHSAQDTQQMLGGGGQTVNIGTVQIHNNMDQQKFLKDLGWRLSLA